jgi:uncharacterized OsmC-like protein
MTEDEKMAYIEKVEARCPISDNLANSTPIKVVLK